MVVYRTILGSQSVCRRASRQKGVEWMTKSRGLVDLFERWTARGDWDVLRCGLGYRRCAKSFRHSWPSRKWLIGWMFARRLSDGWWIDRYSRGAVTLERCWFHVMRLRNGSWSQRKTKSGKAMSRPSQNGGGSFGGFLTISVLRLIRFVRNSEGNLLGHFHWVGLTEMCVGAHQQRPTIW